MATGVGPYVACWSSGASSPAWNGSHLSDHLILLPLHHEDLREYSQPPKAYVL
jgi:hypothetical protein